MKKEQRFIITEIYGQDLHAVNKVLVDTQTRVQYLLHQEGASCAMVCLLDENGLPLLADSMQPIEIKKEKIIEEVDRIKERGHDEIIESFPPVEIR